jgi:nickel/cobalt transporter (NicO) family protein
MNLPREGGTPGRVTAGVYPTAFAPLAGHPREPRARTLDVMGRRRGSGIPLRRRVAALAAVIAVFLAPGIVLGHPLGNFTINHYAGIRVDADRVLLDVVIDQAEIPAFQARLGFDTDGDGQVSDAEVDAGRVTACTTLQGSLSLTVGGSAQTLALAEAGLSFPPGAGGLSTMRMVCGFVAALGSPIAAGTSITYRDGSFPERIGWREIVSSGSAMTITGSDGAALRTTSPSQRLTAYPADLIPQPLADPSVSLVATPGGATLAPFDIPDATPVPGGPVEEPGVVATTPIASPTTVSTGGIVPGGVSASDLPSIFRTVDLTPLVLLVSLATALVLGAGHALTPGHGKTLMAAYLVGSRGTAIHAVGLGLSVTLSHTLGIIALAALVIGAQGVLAPDLVARTAPVVAGISIIAIGGWMLIGEVRRRRGRAALARSGAPEPADHDHGHDHEAAHAHAAAHADPSPYPRMRVRPHADPHAAQGTAQMHDHPHPHEQPHPHEADHEPNPGMHSHGGVTHSHLPPPGSTITWRSLFVLGLAGGLIPSTSALLMLLGAIAAGRPAFGFVLVVAFGLGMALVMGGIGFVLVRARNRLDKFDAGSSIGRAGAYVPLAAAVLVFSLGLYLTFQAVAGAPVL